MEAEPVQCLECQGQVTIHNNDRDVVFHLCGRSMCPFWHPEHPDVRPWHRLDRWFENKRRTEKERIDSVEIPD